MKTIPPVSTSLFRKANFTRKIYLPLFVVLFFFSNDLLAGLKPFYKNKNNRSASTAIKHQAARRKSVSNGPTLSYSSPQSYLVNSPITPLSPTSSNVAAPGYSSSAATIGSGFLTPTGVAVDGSGNVYVADQGNNAVKEIPAGNGTPINEGYTFNQPAGVAVDGSGNIYVADFSNNAVEEIFPSQGVMRTSAVSFTQPTGVAVDGAGNIYVADEGANAVMKLQGGISGTAVTIGSGFSGPAGVAVDAAGNVYVADYGNNAVKEIPAGNGAPIIIGSGFSHPAGVAVDPLGNVYVADEGNAALKEIPAGNGTPITIRSGFNAITGVAVDYLGNVYAANSGNNTINEISRAGGYYLSAALPAGLTLNGTTGIISGTPTVASPSTIYTITAYNADGSVSAGLTIRITSVPPPTISYTSPQTYVAGAAITPLTPNGSSVAVPGYSVATETIGAGFFDPNGVAVDAAGNVYVADEDNNEVKEIPAGNGTPIIIGSGFFNPIGIAVDAAGNVYVADTGNNAIKEISAGNGTVTILGSGFTSPVAVAVDAAGNVYVTDESNSSAIKKIPAGNGVPVIFATGFNNPSGLAVDAFGNVYVADHGNSAIKEIPAGSSTPIIIGSGFDQPAGVAVDAFGNVYVADRTAMTIKEIPAGNGTPVSLGPGLDDPISVAVDALGNVYATNFENNVVNEITPTGGYYLSHALPVGLTLNPGSGVISGTATAASPATNYTITAYNAGGGTSAAVNITVTPFAISYNSPQTYTKGVTIMPLAPNVTGAIAAPGFNSGVTAVGSGFSTPAGVAVDAAGNIYVADAAHNEVKKMPPGGGTPVVLGSGFTGPAGIAVDALGNLYISDTGNNEVKEIAAGSSSITVLGSDFSSPYGIAVDAAGDVFVADYGNNAIKEIPAGSSTPVIVGSGFTHPLGVTVDAAGNLYVTDSGNGAVKKIPAGGGSVVTLSSGFGLAFGIAVDPSGNLYVSDRTNSKVYTLPSAGGTLAAIGSGFTEPSGLALDAAGNVYVADQTFTVLKEIEPIGGYYLSTALPAGLTFSNSTGIVSGTPTTLSAAKTYTVTAYNGAAGGQGTVSIAVAAQAITLTGLKISAGTLTPVFAAATTSYTASVVNTITSITVTPAVAIAGSTITVNGTAVTSGAASGAIALTVGANTINTVVTNGGAIQTYTITVTRAPASNAKLSFLGLSQVTLSPSFSNATTSYTASVANSLTSTNVDAIEVGPGATITVNGVSVASGASTPVALSAGSNTINAVVTAQDGVTQLTYTVTVTRALSAIATLSDITLSSGALSPAFSGSTTSYTALAGSSVTSITETPTTTDPTATVKVNGVAVTPGNPSAAIPLSVGANAITTVVTAQNGTTTDTYTVTVTRPSSNAKLSFLGLSQVVLSPSFATATTGYTASVANTLATTNVLPIEVGPGATIKVNGVTVASGASTPVALSVGNNTINTVVTAQDGVTQLTYTVVVTRAPSAIATLSNLTLSSGTLSPAFGSSKTSYTATVGNAVTSTTETPVTTDPTATVTVNGITVTSGSASAAIALGVGGNTITTVVTAGNGTTTDTYTVIVTRAPSSNAKLSYLGLSKIVLSPSFATATTSYTASVVNSIASTNVEPITVDPTATIELNGVAVASGSSTPVTLNVGANVINTVVTAQDGVTQLTYTVTVTRAAPSGAYVVFDPVSVEKPTDSPQLADDGIVVHQGVSPNGDGIDDYLQIDNITNYPDNKLTIINRSGMLVYETKGYDNSSRTFDGHSNKNGQMQFPGTYFYALDYTVNGIIKHKTGYIVLKY